MRVTPNGRTLLAQQSFDTYRSPEEIHNLRNAEPQEEESVRWSVGNPLATSMIESALQTNEETYSAHSFPAQVFTLALSISLVILRWLTAGKFPVFCV